MGTISQLKKQADNAPKFILVAYQNGKDNYVYVADRFKTECNLTENLKNALKFSYGFDDELIKEKAWSLSTGFEFMAIPA